MRWSYTMAPLAGFRHFADCPHRFLRRKAVGCPNLRLDQLLLSDLVGSGLTKGGNAELKARLYDDTRPLRRLEKRRLDAHPVAVWSPCQIHKRSTVHYAQ